MTNDRLSKLGLPLSKILRAQKDVTHDHMRKVIVKVISEVTFEPLDKIVSFFLADYGLLPLFDVSGFDQLNHEIFNLEEAKSDCADFIYVHNSTLKFFTKASGTQRTGTTEAFQDIINDYLKSIRQFIDGAGRSVIILNLFELPPYRIRGSHSTRSGIIKTIQWANTQILSLCDENKNVLIHDANYISANIGLANWYDFGAWASFKQPFSGSALKDFGASIASVIASHLGKSKKILITDFDNTLWGGVIGEVGAEGVEIGANSPKGEIFSLVQSYIFDLMASGIILAACSKNEEKNVQSAFKQPSSHLLIEDFASKKINWSQKSINIIEILNDLNIGDDSAVFIDDNPAEILEVSGNLTGCSCVSYDSIAIEMIQSIDALGFFEMQSISNDDLTRNQSYKENTYRNQSLHSFVDYNEFLTSLEMTVSIFWKSSNNFERLVSLNNKTNQFNTNQVTLSQLEIENYIEASDKFVLSVSLTDKFGPLGIISVMFGELQNDECIIKNWVLSCRVFKRGVEAVILDALSRKVRELNINCIRASINLSEKNMYCRKVFNEFGFIEVKSTSVGSEYYLDINEHAFKTGDKYGPSITTTFS
jgi:FkbH-like protein